MDHVPEGESPIKAISDFLKALLELCDTQDWKDTKYANVLKNAVIDFKSLFTQIHSSAAT